MWRRVARRQEALLANGRLEYFLLWQNATWSRSAERCPLDELRCQYVSVFVSAVGAINRAVVYLEYSYALETPVDAVLCAVARDYAAKTGRRLALDSSEVYHVGLKKSAVRFQHRIPDRQCSLLAVIATQQRLKCRTDFIYLVLRESDQPLDTKFSRICITAQDEARPDPAANPVFRNAERAIMDSLREHGSAASLGAEPRGYEASEALHPSVLPADLRTRVSRPFLTWISQSLHFQFPRTIRRVQRIHALPEFLEAMAREVSADPGVRAAADLRGLYPVPVIAPPYITQGRISEYLDRTPSSLPWGRRLFLLRLSERPAVRPIDNQARNDGVNIFAASEDTKLYLDLYVRCPFSLPLRIALWPAAMLFRLLHSLFRATRLAIPDETLLYGEPTKLCPDLPALAPYAAPEAFARSVAEECREKAGHEMPGSVPALDAQLRDAIATGLPLLAGISELAESRGMFQAGNGTPVASYAGNAVCSSISLLSSQFLRKARNPQGRHRSLKLTPEQRFVALVTNLARYLNPYKPFLPCGYKYPEGPAERAGGYSPCAAFRLPLTLSTYFIFLVSLGLLAIWKWQTASFAAWSRLVKSVIAVFYLPSLSFAMSNLLAGLSFFLPPGIITSGIRAIDPLGDAGSSYHHFYDELFREEGLHYRKGGYHRVPHPLDGADLLRNWEVQDVRSLTSLSKKYGTKVFHLVLKRVCPALLLEMEFLRNEACRRLFPVGWDTFEKSVKTILRNSERERAWREERAPGAKADYRLPDVTALQITPAFRLASSLASLVASQYGAGDGVPAATVMALCVLFLDPLIFDIFIGILVKGSSPSLTPLDDLRCRLFSGLEWYESDNTLDGSDELSALFHACFTESQGDARVRLLAGETVEYWGETYSYATLARFIRGLPERILPAAFINAEAAWTNMLLNVDFSKVFHGAGPEASLAPGALEAPGSAGPPPPANEGVRRGALDWAVSFRKDLFLFVIREVGATLRLQEMRDLVRQYQEEAYRILGTHHHGLQVLSRVHRPHKTLQTLYMFLRSIVAE